MPIYEYQCTGCHHHFDAIQKVGDAPLTECPHCKEAKAVRLISAAGFQLKGSGWYVTDFKNKKDHKTETASTQSESASTSEKKSNETQTGSKSE